MANLNTSIADAYTKHSVNLMRIEESLSRMSVRYLRRLRDEIIKELKTIDPTEVQAASYRTARLKKLLEQTNETIKTTYRSFRDELKNELVELSAVEANYAGNSVNKILQAEVMTVGMPRAALRTIVNKSLIQGNIISDWMSRLAGNTKFRLQDQMRMGVLAGEPLQDLVIRVRGSAIPGRPGRYIGGVIETSTREATAIARTAAQTISNNVRESMIKDNEDVLKGMELLVTLDMRTSDICISRSKMAWDFDGKPLPGTGTTIKYPGPPPYHFNCRSTLIPVIKSLEELGARTKVKLPESTQASMDGQVSEKLTYEDWLSTKSVATQKEVLGPTKHALWKEGKIDNFRELIDQRGRPLTVAELRAKYE